MVRAFDDWEQGVGEGDFWWQFDTHRGGLGIRTQRPSGGGHVIEMWAAGRECDYV